MSKDLNDVFNEFLLSMLNSSNGNLITELRIRWKEYLNQPIIKLPLNDKIQYYQKTDDNMTVGSNDSVYVVFKDGSTDFNCTMAESTYCIHAGGKVFGSKKNAEDYSKEHKLEYSINDFRKIVKDIADGALGRDTRSYLNQRLANLSNSKTGSADR